MKTRNIVIPAVTVAAIAAIPAIQISSQSPTPAETSPRSAPQELAPYQAELLELAFEAASAFPLEPHIKNRSRAQDSVVAACFELDQPDRALRYIKEIANWRQAAGYADYAVYHLRHGGAYEDVQPLVALAEERVSRMLGDMNEQAWRVDRIRNKIATVHLLLDEAQKAAELTQGVADSQSGAVDAFTSSTIDIEDFDAHVASLEATLEGASFDIARNTVSSLIILYDRFYTDAGKRDRLEQTIRTAYARLPMSIQLDCLLLFGESALENGDEGRALELGAECQTILDDYEWALEELLPQQARTASLRYRAGDKIAARRAADESLAQYHERREEITNMFRGSTLRPLAEALHAMGDAEAARTVYKLAVEEGVENPNSRPRANDLVAVCLSLALSEVEPDEELFARLREVRANLGDPW